MFPPVSVVWEDEIEVVKDVSVGAAESPACCCCGGGGGGAVFLTEEIDVFVNVSCGGGTAAAGECLLLWVCILEAIEAGILGTLAIGMLGTLAIGILGGAFIETFGVWEDGMGGAALFPLGILGAETLVLVFPTLGSGGDAIFDVPVLATFATAFSSTT